MGPHQLWRRVVKTSVAFRRLTEQHDHHLHFIIEGATQRVLVHVSHLSRCRHVALRARELCLLNLGRTDDHPFRHHLFQHVRGRRYRGIQ